jgi:two-component system phosphate regulon response regulator PhoB
MPRLLIVEDEIELRALLQGHLESDGHLVDAASDGETALAHHARHPADLILLDLGLPHLDGLSLIKMLRERGDDVPIVVLTARGGEEAKIQGLDLGADDYLTKPYALLEVLARVRALLRRSKPKLPAGRVLKSGPYRIDLLHHCVRRGTQTVELGHREFRLLEILLTRPGRTFSRRELLNLAWEADARPGPRTVDAHVAHLRKKLGDSGRTACITTAEGEGYAWTREVVAQS